MKWLLIVLVACGHSPQRIGVAECDAYEAKMAACADRVGGEVGVQLERMRRSMGDAWRKDTANPELPQVCAAAVADIARQLPQCAW